MRITPANVGDIIQTVPNGHLVQIREVTEDYVHYLDETGSEYGTLQHEIEGTVIQDPERIKAFQNNYLLGSSLKKAELSAIRNMLDASSTREQMQDADSVLKSVRHMKQTLAERIQQQTICAPVKQAQHSPLDAIISRASAKAQHQTKQPVAIGHDR